MTARKSAKKAVKRSSAQRNRAAQQSQALAAVDPNTVQPGAVISKREGADLLAQFDAKQREHVLAWLTASLQARALPAPKFVISKQGQVVPDPSLTLELMRAGIMSATGFARGHAGDEIVGRLAALASATTDSKARTVELLNSMIAQCTEIGPRDGVEGLLTAQMVITAQESLRLLAQAAASTSLPHSTFNYNQSARLMRLYAQQMDALQRYRGKGPSEQKVTVQHVHVAAGGQAIVGAVKHGGEGAHPGGEHEKH